MTFPDTVFVSSEKPLSLLAWHVDNRFLKYLKITFLSSRDELAKHSRIDISSYDNWKNKSRLWNALEKSLGKLKVLIPLIENRIFPYQIFLNRTSASNFPSHKDILHRLFLSLLLISPCLSHNCIPLLLASSRVFFRAGQVWKGK